MLCSTDASKGCAVRARQHDSLNAPRRPSLARRVVAEGIGTALLLATVIGSGIMAERLAGGNVAIALLANTIATGGGLAALILTFGGISGAHFNPAVTVADASQGGLRWGDVVPYVVAQLIGAFVGVALAHVMFDVPDLQRLPPRPIRDGAARGRVHGDLRLGLGDLGLLPIAASRDAVRGRRLHHGRVLVHVVDVIRQPGRDARARRVRNVRGHPARGRAGLHRRSSPGSHSRHAPVSVARPELAGVRRQRAHPCRHGGRRMSAIKTRVLFICIHNSARSQMAEAFLKQLAGDRFEVESAGLEPGKLNPLAVQAMKLIGTEIGQNRTQSVFDLFKAGRRFQYVISVCDEASAERCLDPLPGRHDTPELELRRSVLVHRDGRGAARQDDRGPRRDTRPGSEMDR